MLLPSVLAIASLLVGTSAQNSTYTNPILPGFHPDPSCIFLQCLPRPPNPRLTRPAKLETHRQCLFPPGNAPSASHHQPFHRWYLGPALRFHGGKFWISTTLVFDDLPKDNESRWDNFVISTEDPYDSLSWSDPVHFKFGGYDTSLFWDDDVDGQVYVTGSHQYTVWPGIQQATIDLTTGAMGPLENPWNGTGGLAPEGPHVYKKDGFYYLMLAEGGTGLGHMVTMARSKGSIHGPYEPAPHNPLLTNANTSAYFQTVGHADLFQDPAGQWWGVALSTRSGPQFLNYPMGRETIMTPVTWEKGEWPVFEPVSGTMNGWKLPSKELVKDGAGPYITDPDHLTFPPGSSIPLHLIHWRLPTPDTYLVSPPGKPNTLVIRSSVLNLTAYDGYYTGGLGQSFIARRQTDTLFTYQVDIDASGLKNAGDEVGVSVFLVQRYHFELGIVLLPTPSSSLAPFFRFRGISNISIPDSVVPVPAGVQLDGLAFEIKAFNTTHYAFSAGPKGAQSLWSTYGLARGDQMSWGFTGTLVGVYATTNGRNGSFEAGVGEWRYVGQGEVIN
ncbi:beta-xylosidase [Cyathus striatus]|nr:beta-xylosidase [Cyathus striatus]